MGQFKGNRAFIAQSRVATKRIVEIVDVIAHQYPGLFFTPESLCRLVAQEFGFECAKEAFGYGIV